MTREELWLRYLAGEELSEEEHTLLLQHLKSDEEFARRCAVDREIALAARAALWEAHRGKAFFEKLRSALEASQEAVTVIEEVDGDWRLVPAQGPARPMLEDDLKTLGQWTIGPLIEGRPLEQRFATGTAQRALCLHAEVAGGDARLRVEVRAERVSTRHLYQWQVKVSLEPGGKLAPVYVGLAPKGEAIHERLSVSADREVTLVAPCDDRVLQLSCSYPRGEEWVEEMLDLPLRKG